MAERAWTLNRDECDITVYHGSPVVAKAVHLPTGIRSKGAHENRECAVNAALQCLEILVYHRAYVGAHDALGEGAAVSERTWFHLTHGERDRIMRDLARRSPAVTSDPFMDDVSVSVTPTGKVTAVHVPTGLSHFDRYENQDSTNRVLAKLKTEVAEVATEFEKRIKVSHATDMVRMEKTTSFNHPGTGLSVFCRTDQFADERKLTLEKCRAIFKLLRMVADQKRGMVPGDYEVSMALNQFGDTVATATHIATGLRETRMAKWDQEATKNAVRALGERVLGIATAGGAMVEATLESTYAQYRRLRREAGFTLEDAAISEKVWNECDAEAQASMVQQMIVAARKHQAELKATPRNWGNW